MAHDVPASTPEAAAAARAAVRGDAIDRIAAVNRGRAPALLRRKFDAMAGDPFVFLRATALLGHQSVDLDALPEVPLGWICGDLHLQNFGCFRGANRLVYFDLNDFDEAARMPVALDLLRLLGSILCAAPGIGLKGPAALELVAHALDAYAQALARGKAFWLERETAVGAIGALLARAGQRRRGSLLTGRTRSDGKRRRLLIDGKRYLALAADDPARAGVAQALGELAHEFCMRQFFDARDVAFRVAGMGSLGLPRYVALVRGKGDPDRNALIDFKRAAPSSAAAAFPQFAQPAWRDEGTRVVAIQDICEAASPAFLCTLLIGGRAFIARELQPVEDKVALAPLVLHIDRIQETLSSMGRLAAFAQLRSAGRAGAAPAEAFIDFGRRLASAPHAWLDAARAVDAANLAHYRRFRAAWQAGDPRLVKLCSPEKAGKPPPE